jgi:hypothetical protein
VAAWLEFATLFMEKDIGITNTQKKSVFGTNTYLPMSPAPYCMCYKIPFTKSHIHPIVGARGKFLIGDSSGIKYRSSRYRKRLKK